MPIMMSAFGYPGAGQLMQRRWLWAAVYALAFTVCLVFFCVYVFRIISAYYSLWLDFDKSTTPGRLPVREVLVSLLASVVVYVAALIDTHAAYRRACAAWAGRRVPSPGQEPAGG